RDVEGSVLLGTEDLLALEQEDRLAGGVVDRQVVDGRPALKLADGDAARASLAKAEVLQPRGRAEQRKDGEVAGDVGIADPERLGEEGRESRGIGGCGLLAVHAGCVGRCERFLTAAQRGPPTRANRKL